MRKFIAVLCMLGSLFANSQTFYEPNDFKVEFMQMSTSSYWQSNYIEPTWSYSYVDGKGVMCATWFIEGKFATIYFGKEKTDLGVCGTDGLTDMVVLNENVQLQMQYTPGEIEFDKIAYNPNMQAVLIPYGIVSSFMGTDYSLLSVSLYDVLHSGISSIVSEEAKGTQTYYNLNGQMVKPETSTNGIIIKSDGTSVEKILNMR